MRIYQQFASWLTGQSVKRPARYIQSAGCLASQQNVAGIHTSKILQAIWPATFAGWPTIYLA